MNEYLKPQEIGDKWGVTARQVQFLCKNGRIVGAIKFGNTWAIPQNAEKPIDKRIRLKEK